MRFSIGLLAVAIATPTLVATACGDDGDGTAGSGGDRPQVVASTTILGDVVDNLAGDAVEVVTIMPIGADPHDFQPSAQQVAQISNADAVIVNGAGFEEGLLDVIEAAEGDGVPVFEAVSAVETLEFGEHEDGQHADQGEDGAEGDHTDEGDHDGEGEEAHDHEGVDPHFFTDPARMAVAADAMIEFIASNIDGVDLDELTADAEAYADQLEALDAEVAQVLDGVPADGRVLVTNHGVFGYFADRYDFEIVGTVIPGGSTTDSASAQELAELTEVVEQEGVPAIFADTSSSDELARGLADDVGDIEIVQLFSESVGDPDSEGSTYVDMVRANAQRIADALTG